MRSGRTRRGCADLVSTRPGRCPPAGRRTGASARSSSGKSSARHVDGATLLQGSSVSALVKPSAETQPKMLARVLVLASSDWRHAPSGSIRLQGVRQRPDAQVTERTCCTSPLLFGPRLSGAATLEVGGGVLAQRASPSAMPARRRRILLHVIVAIALGARRSAPERRAGRRASAHLESSCCDPAAAWTPSGASMPSEAATAHHVTVGVCRARAAGPRPSS